MEDGAPVPDREIVAARRGALDLSYEKLAERLSVLCGTEIKWQSIQQFEKGDTKNPRFLWQLAKALETTDEFLSGRTTDPKINHPLTKNGVVSPKVQRGPADREGQTMLSEALRAIGVLEERIRLMDARIAEMERPHHTGAKNPLKGTREQ